MTQWVSLMRYTHSALKIIVKKEFPFHLIPLLLSSPLHLAPVLPQVSPSQSSIP